MHAGATFPPASTNEPWNAVTTTTTQVNYPICGFSYILSDENGTELSGFGMSEANLTTVHDFFTFALGDTEAGEGTEILENNSDFLPLPNPPGSEDVRKIAQEGVEKIGF